MEPQLIGIIAALCSAASWAMGAILFKKLGESLSPFAMTLVKCAISLVLLGLAVLLVGYDQLSPQTLGLLGVSGILGIAISDTLFFAALKHLGARDMVLLMTMGQVFTILLAITVLKEQPIYGQWIGIALVVSGVTVVLFGQLPPEKQASQFKGLMLGILSSFAMSISTILTNIALQTRISAANSAMQLTRIELQGTLIRMLAGGVGLLIYGVATRSIGGWVSPFQSKGLAGRFLMAVTVVTFGGFFLSQVAVTNGQVSTNSTLISTEPLFALVLAAIFLKERITYKVLAGTIITFGGIVFLCSKPPF